MSKDIYVRTFGRIKRMQPGVLEGWNAFFDRMRPCTQGSSALEYRVRPRCTAWLAGRSRVTSAHLAAYCDRMEGGRTPYASHCTGPWHAAAVREWGFPSVAARGFATSRGGTLAPPPSSPQPDTTVVPGLRRAPRTRTADENERERRRLVVRSSRGEGLAYAGHVHRRVRLRSRGLYSVRVPAGGPAGVTLSAFVRDVHDDPSAFDGFINRFGFSDFQSPTATVPTLRVFPDRREFFFFFLHTLASTVHFILRSVRTNCRLRTRCTNCNVRQTPSAPFGGGETRVLAAVWNLFYF